VLFKNARIVRGLDRVAAEARKHGTELLIDAYHAIGAMPFDVAEQQLDAAFIVGGGYKYCQLGEGNCFLRVPPGCRLRPVATGWFAEFDQLERATPGQVRYPAGGAQRFSGSTYDPTSHYRAAAVFDFFRGEGLDAELLRTVSQHQLGVLREAFDALDVDAGVIRREQVAIEELGGFLTLTSPHAASLQRALRERGVLCDARDDSLRLGPAPYLSDRQLRDALDALRESLAAL
jgi:kynureninase